MLEAVLYLVFAVGELATQSLSNLTQRIAERVVTHVALVSFVLPEGVFPSILHQIPKTARTASLVSGVMKASVLPSK